MRFYETMIESLRGMAVFVAVAEAGSFVGAARRLGLTTSVVSHHIKKFEDYNNVALFYRSTRALSLTADGQRLLEPALRMIAAAEQGLDALADVGAEPAGAITLSLPGFLSAGDIEQAIWEFAARYTSVALTLRKSDSQVDLIAEGYDLAIRFGRLRDSGLKTRRLGSFQRKLVAAPSYLAKIGPLATPDDLARCDAVAMEFLPDQIELAKGRSKRICKLERTRIQVDAVEAARAAVIMGLGIQRLPTSSVEDDLRAKRLVEVLPDWSLPDLGIYAVWPANGHRNNLTRRLIDHLVAFGK